MISFKGWSMVVSNRSSCYLEHLVFKSTDDLVWFWFLLQILGYLTWIFPFPNIWPWSLQRAALSAAPHVNPIIIRFTSRADKPSTWPILQGISPGRSAGTINLLFHWFMHFAWNCNYQCWLLQISNLEILSVIRMVRSLPSVCWILHHFHRCIWCTYKYSNIMKFLLFLATLWSGPS